MKLKEAMSLPASDYDYYIKRTARYLADDPNLDSHDVSNDVFRPSSAEEVVELADGVDPSAIRPAIERFAKQFGVDPDALQEVFLMGLDATEEWTESDMEEDDY